LGREKSVINREVPWFSDVWAEDRKSALARKDGMRRPGLFLIPLGISWHSQL
jgi:hypothetical protein